MSLWQCGHIGPPKHALFVHRKGGEISEKALMSKFIDFTIGYGLAKVQNSILSSKCMKVIMMIIIIILIVLLQIGLVGHEAPILLNPDQSFWSQTVTHLDHHHHSFWSSIVFIFIFIIKSEKKGSKEGSSSMVTKCQLTRDCFLTFVRENSRKSWTRKKSHFQPRSKRIKISNPVKNEKWHL